MIQGFLNASKINVQSWAVVLKSNFKLKTIKLVSFNNMGKKFKFGRDFVMLIATCISETSI